MNPYELTGPVFLGVMTVAMAASIGLAAVVRVQMSQRGSVETPNCADPKALPLDPYDYAVLSGGRRNAFLSALAALSHKGIIDITSDKVSQVGAPVNVTNWLERNIVDQVARDSKRIGVLFTGIKNNVQFDLIDDKLARYGLILGKKRLNQIRLATVAIVAFPLLVLGLPKLMVGLSAGKPVAFLIFELMMGLFFVVVFAAQKDKPTEAGKAVLKTARDSNNALLVNYQSAPYALAGTDLVLGAALFGSVASSNDPYMKARSNMGGCGSAPSSGCGSGGSSCGSGSSCGGGGGGCGGGGCGGCGG